MVFFILGPLVLEDQLKSAVTPYQASCRVGEYRGEKKKTSPQIVHSLSGKGIKHKEISYKYQSRSVDKVQKAVVVGVRSPSVQRELPKRSDTFSWVVRGKKRKTSSERHLKEKEPGYKAVCFFLHVK